MSNDLLDMAVRAYRLDTADGADRLASRTLDRILESKQRRHLRPLVWVAALTLSAIAGAAIRELPQIRAAVARRHLEARSVERTELPASATQLLELGARPREDLSTQESALAPAPTVAAVSARASSVRSRHLPSRAGTALNLARDDEGPPSDRDDALFREIALKHASATDAEDLAGWQRYLTAYPDGRFAPEARYRRAVALARLGDESAALAAFVWFERDEQGQSRRADARRWIQVLSAEQ